MSPILLQARQPCNIVRWCHHAARCAAAARFDSRLARYLASLGMQSEKLKGNLDMLLLSVLSAGPGHGYSIITRLRDRSAGAFDCRRARCIRRCTDLSKPACWRAAGRWSAGRRRRIYRLTTAGERSLAEEARQWRAFSGSVSLVLGGRRHERAGGGLPGRAAAHAARHAARGQAHTGRSRGASARCRGRRRRGGADTARGRGGRRRQGRADAMRSPAGRRSSPGPRRRCCGVPRWPVPWSAAWRWSPTAISAAISWAWQPSVAARSSWPRSRPAVTPRRTARGG